MPVDAITSSNGGGVTLDSLQNIDVQAFLTLMTTQMRYQDPLSPQSDTQFMSQLAQLTSVQELKDLNTQTAYNSRAQAVSQASTLIGKVIEGVSATTGESVAGIVSEVRSDGYSTLLVIGNDAVEIGNVTRAYDINSANVPTELDLQKAAALVGKSVFGVQKDGTPISGVVDGVYNDGGSIKLSLTLPAAEQGGESSTAAIYYQDLLSYEGIAPSESLSLTSWLIGREVKAVDPDSTTDPKETFTGTVTGVRLTNGSIVLEIGTKRVALDALRKVS
jgi:flagellar basal-body rod modification protein FlgD